jgi:hypothetical protein
MKYFISVRSRKSYDITGFLLSFVYCRTTVISTVTSFTFLKLEEHLSRPSVPAHVSSQQPAEHSEKYRSSIHPGGERKKGEGKGKEVLIGLMTGLSDC